MSLKKQTVWSALPLVVVTATNLVSVPLFYRFLGADTYALWFAILTLCGAAGFMDLGLGVTVGRFVGMAIGSGNRDAVREYWATGHLISLPVLATLCCGFFAVCWTFGPGWFNLAPERASLFRTCMIAATAGIFANYYGQLWLVLAQMHHDYRFLATVRTGFNLLQLFASIGIAVVTADLLLILWAATMLSFIQLGILVQYARKRYGLGFGFAAARRDRWREMQGYAWKCVAAMFAAASVGSLDRLILGRFAPASAFLHYTIAANLGQRLQQVSLAIMAPVFSNTNRAVGEDDRHRPGAIYEDAFQFVFGWFALAFFGAWAWGAPLAQIWLGPSVGVFVGELIPPLIGAACLTALGNISSSQLGSLNRLGILLSFTLASGLAGGLGAWLGWSSIGVLGAAWGFFASRIVVLFQDFYLIRLVGGGGWASFNTFRQTTVQVSIAVLVFGLSKLAPYTSIGQLAFAMLHAAIAGLVILASHIRPKWLPAFARLSPLRRANAQLP